ncbi:MAG TPA: hypothetical protein VKX96_11250 [Chloroflexota bacterium]|nr:hypothetical protein [Chloroflexota bacterium]
MSKLVRVLLIFGAVIGLMALAGTALAQRLPRNQTQPLGGVIAIGELTEPDGTIQTVDLRAGERNNQQGGNLRFYCPKMGYYNGAVRSVSIRNGTANLSGGGALTKPDGSRERVTFTMTVTLADKHVTVNVQDKDGQTYTMDGNLNPGFVVIQVLSPVS